MWYSFNESQGSILIVGDERYFLVENKKGYRFIVPAKCPHRGGPLYMGTVEGSGACIRCPWHNIATPINSLTRRALPSVRIGTQWTVRIPENSNKRNFIVMPVKPMSIQRRDEFANVH